ncbi:MAG: putative Ig domain-containing protein, partial [Microthrixaceae bacterium]|nr:putative Ig domain-containing protein [Microthrixaceae bacterium]
MASSRELGPVRVGRRAAGAVVALVTLVSVLVGGPPAGASSVGSVTAAVSPAVAGATGARWTIGFTNTTALSSSDTVTVTAPAGTVLPNSCTYQVIDTTPNPDVSWTVCPTQPVDVNQSVLQLWSDVPAGHALQLVIDDVANPGTAGSQSVSISTSTDTDAVSAAVNLSAGPTAVTGVSASVVPAVAGATGARWTVGFTTTSALNTSYSTVDLSAPAGTVLPNSCTYQVIDTTPTPDVVLSSCVTSGGGTNEVKLAVYGDVPAGHVLQLVIDDVGNPPNAGSYPVSVSTTSDRAPVTANVALSSGPTAVSAVSVVSSPAVAGATGARWTVGFTNTSALNNYYSRVVVSAPAGTVLPASCTYQLVDTTPNPDVTLSGCVTSGGGTNEVEIYPGADVPAGHVLQLVIDDVGNPPNAGSYPVSVSTTSDRAPVTANVALTSGPTAVTGVGVALDNTLPGATSVTYTIGFTNTSALNYYYSRVVVSAPAGTVLPSSCTYQLVDTTPNPDATTWACPTAGGGTNEVEIYVGGDVPAGHALQLVIPEVTNPASSGSKTLTIRTSSDQVPVTAGYSLGLGVSTTALPSATAGDAYSATLTATGGTGPYTWSMAPGSGSLPSGLSLDPSTGTISGTPGAGTGGTYSNLVFRVKDS